MKNIILFLNKPLTVRLWQIIVFILMVGVIIYLLRKPKVYTIPNKDFKAVVTTKDKNGIDHSTIVVQKVQDTHIQDSLQQVLAKGTKIVEVTRWVSKVDTVFQDVPVYIDSTKRFAQFEKKDNYIDLTGVMDLQNNIVDIGLVSIDTLTYAQTFKKGIYKIDLSNKNPYVHIVSGYSISIVPKKPMLTVGPMIGLEYSIKGNLIPIYGIGVQVPIFTIKQWR